MDASHIIHYIDFKPGENKAWILGWSRNDKTSVETGKIEAIVVVIVISRKTEDFLIALFFQFLFEKV